MPLTLKGTECNHYKGEIRNSPNRVTSYYKYLVLIKWE